MKKRRIQPGWRYTLAQYVLRLLFGRSWHYISPWKLMAAGAGAVVISPDGKVLLQQRAGNIENAGCWGIFGGYLDPENHETLADCLAREIYEESGLVVPPEQFKRLPNDLEIQYQQELIDIADFTTIAARYWVQAPLEIIHQLSLSNEVAAFRWFTQQEVEQLQSQGKLSGYSTLQRAYEDFHAGKVIPALQY